MVVARTKGHITPSDYHCSKSLAKHMRKTTPRVTINACFDDVIEACADIPRQDNGTWITDEMIEAYKDMHRAGHAHSIEVWQGNNLVGGLYGIAVGKVFCGESMFSFTTNSSKVAFHVLVNHMKKINANFIDCQMLTPHLKSLGCCEVSRDVFLRMLNSDKHASLPSEHWARQELVLN